MNQKHPDNPVVLHPWLLAMFPVLFLYARNLGELDFGDVVFPLMASVALAAGLYLVLRLPVRSGQRRGLMVSCLIALFYSYANIASLARSVLPLPPGRWAWPYYVIWLLIAAAALVVIARLKRSLPYWTKILNVIALSLVVLNGVRIVAAVPDKLAVWKGELIIPEPWQGPDLTAAAQRPNFFILVFDQHVGFPCLKRYGYDAGEFIDALRDRGFHVAENSTANYWMTPYAMAGLFNYTYLDFILDQIPEGFKGHQPAFKLTRDNRAFRFLKEAGYTTIQCHTDFLYPYENIDNVDIRINPDRWYTTALSRELISNTPLSLRTPGLLRRSILTAFEETTRLCRLDEPFIVFTHFLSPHPPYIFDEQGRLPGPNSAYNDFDVQFCADEDKRELRLYLAEMTYLHKRIIEMVDAIQANSKRPPVIILQGDHGNRLQVRRCQDRQLTPDAAMELFSILNALYLPGVDPDGLPDAVSPVNTFRLLFDRYFGTDLGLLPDRCYYPGPSGQLFEDVTDLVLEGLK